MTANKIKILDKMSLAYAQSYKAAYNIHGIPFGAKQQETYCSDFFIRIQAAKNSYTRDRVAEEVLKFRKSIGEK